jgi:hypothetical protein
MFPVVLCGCETWSFTLQGEHRLRVLENRMLRAIFGPNCIMRSFTIRVLHWMLLGYWKQGGLDSRDMKKTKITYRILVENVEKCSVERRGHTWDDNIDIGPKG